MVSFHSGMGFIPDFGCNYTEMAFSDIELSYSFRNGSLFGNQ